MNRWMIAACFGVLVGAPIVSIAADTGAAGTGTTGGGAGTTGRAAGSGAGNMGGSGEAGSDVRTHKGAEDSGRPNDPHTPPPGGDRGGSDPDTHTGSDMR